MNPELPLIFFPNNHTLVWLPAEPGPVPQLLARIRAGEWQLPASVTERFQIPPDLTFSAHNSASAIIICPNRPLTEKMPGSPARLNAEQVEVLRLMRAGLTARQIAQSLGRGKRWVRYRVAEIRRNGRQAIPSRWSQRRKKNCGETGPQG